MKKLLSLLSVLTISGTAIPTTIAASPYQKEEKSNSEINYLQTNNLETLNRNKRQLWGDQFDDSTLYNSTQNNRSKFNLSSLTNLNTSLGNLLNINDSSILQSFWFNNQHLYNLQHRGQGLVSYLRVGRIYERQGRAILYTEPNNYFEGTITVFWNKHTSGNGYPKSPQHQSPFSPGHIEI
ncbi:hypothetical protein [Spiroplasma sp. ald]|uniref:hypothetical protein n=1 Tax=Spiroplasma sp. ald TaxID=2490849 RepID=UPI0037DD6659